MIIPFCRNKLLFQQSFPRKVFLLISYSPVIHIILQQSIHMIINSIWHIVINIPIVSIYQALTTSFTSVPIPKIMLHIISP